MAKTIYQNYYWLRIAELKLFIEKIKAGNWKQIHGMSPAVLMGTSWRICQRSMQIREDNAKELPICNVQMKEDFERTLSERKKRCKNRHLHGDKIELFKKIFRNNKNRLMSRIKVFLALGITFCGLAVVLMAHRCCYKLAAVNYLKNKYEELNKRIKKKRYAKWI